MIDSRIAFDNQAVIATVTTASHDQAGTINLVDGMTISKWKPASLASTINYAGTFNNIDYIGLAGVNWASAGCSLVVRDGIGGTVLASFSNLGDGQPAIAFITKSSQTNVYFEFTCAEDTLSIGEIYFGESIVLPRSVSVGYEPSRWHSGDNVISNQIQQNQSASSVVWSDLSIEKFTLSFLGVEFMETVFKAFARSAQGLSIFFLWNTDFQSHVVYGVWESNSPTFASQFLSAINMTIKGTTQVVVDDGTLSGSEGGSSGGFGSGASSGGGAFGGGGSAFWFRTSVAFNAAVDFWTLDERNGSSALNIGSGAAGFTSESLDYNPVVLVAADAESSISTGTGFGKNLATFTNRTISGSTVDSGSVFARSNTWGIEFALDLNVTLVDDIVLSFWDSASVAADGIDKLMKIAVDPVDPDILNLILYTTDNDSSFTLRTNVIAPSISALGAGYSYFSIFFISGSTLICRIEDVETLNVDISTWEARLSNVHTTAKFRIGADKDAPSTNVMDGKVDEISTYISASGVNFDTNRTYRWWKDINGIIALPPPIVIVDYETSVQAKDPVHWYTLDETSGTTAIDTGSRGVNLIYLGDASVIDVGQLSIRAKAGNRAKLFTSSFNFIRDTSISSAGWLTPSAGWTIEFSIQQDSITNGSIFEYTTSTGASTENQYQVRIENDNSIQMRIWDDLGGSTFFTLTEIINNDFGDAYAPPIQQPIHIAISYDSSTEIATTYVNGQFQFPQTDLSTRPMNPVLTPAGTFSIGGDPSTGNAGPKASVSEIRIYDKTLSESELNENFIYWYDGTAPSSGDIISKLDGSNLSNQPYDTSLLVSSAPAKQWISILLEADLSGNYIGKVILETGSNVYVELYEDFGTIVRLSQTGTVSAPFTVLDGKALRDNRLSVLVYNNSTSAQDIQIRVPST